MNNGSERHLEAAELRAGLGRILDAPKHEGVLELTVRRPSSGVSAPSASSSL